jgi:hypothetical protein
MLTFSLNDTDANCGMSIRLCPALVGWLTTRGLYSIGQTRVHDTEPLHCRSTRQHILVTLA